MNVWIFSDTDGLSVLTINAERTNLPEEVWQQHLPPDPKGCKLKIQPALGCIVERSEH